MRACVRMYVCMYVRYTVFLLLNARSSIFFGGLFTRRLLETAADSRLAFIFTCTNFARTRAPFDAHSVSAHGESWQRLLQNTSRAPDGEAEAAGSHYMH